MSTTSWISWQAAAELTGLPVPTIEHAVRVNRIRRRPQRGRAPTLDAVSVEQWAAWYRNLHEQKKLSPRRARSTPAPLPPGEWLSAAEAAVVLGVTAATVRLFADLGQLEAHRDTKIWVAESSVRQLAAERAADRDKWISWTAASEIVGCARDLIPHLVAQGHLEQRPAHRTTPSMRRTSAEDYAPVFAEQRAEAQRHNAETQRARTERSQGPADGGVWLNVETTALVLELSTSRVLQLVHAELLPATQIGRRWWLRRSDVEQAAAARALQSRYATERRIVLRTLKMCPPPGSRCWPSPQPHCRLPRTYPEGTLYEPKWDGYRALLEARARDVGSGHATAPTWRPALGRPGRLTRNVAVDRARSAPHQSPVP